MEGLGLHMEGLGLHMEGLGLHMEGLGLHKWRAWGCTNGGPGVAHGGQLEGLGVRPQFILIQFILSSLIPRPKCHFITDPLRLGTEEKEKMTSYVSSIA